MGLGCEVISERCQGPWVGAQCWGQWWRPDALAGEWRYQREDAEEGREALEKPGSWVDPETTEQ